MGTSDDDFVMIFSTKPMPGVSPQLLPRSIDEVFGIGHIRTVGVQDRHDIISRHSCPELLLYHVIRIKPPPGQDHHLTRRPPLPATHTL